MPLNATSRTPRTGPATAAAAAPSGPRPSIAAPVANAVSARAVLADIANTHQAVRNAARSAHHYGPAAQAQQSQADRARGRVFAGAPPGRVPGSRSCREASSLYGSGL